MRIASHLSIALLLFFALSLSSQADDLPPDRIEDVIAADFDDSSRLGGSDIKIQFNDGLVTLSGTVNSLLDKRMASQFAKRTRGVKAVLNQILIKPTDRSDDKIRDDVVKLLRANGATDRPQIKVNVSRGEVSMMGKVDSLAEKRIAEFVAANVGGVTAVNNQLTVALTRDRDDLQLREEIKTLLVHSVYLDNVNVDVNVKEHVAYLSGAVRTAEQQDFAAQIAGMLGIKSVDTSGLAIDPSAGDKARAKKTLRRSKQ